LTLLDERLTGAGQRRSRQDGSDLREAGHGEELVREKSEQSFS
jgi:hypothetical protein